MAVALLPALLPTGGNALITGLITAAGSYIDSQVLPSLFDGQRKPPEFGGQTVLVADEGAPLNIAIGGDANLPNVGLRLNGAVIWSGDPFPVRQGGNDKRGNSTQHAWFIDAQILLATNYCSLLDRLIVDGETIYDAKPNVNITEQVTRLPADQTVTFVGDFELDYITSLTLLTTVNEISWDLIIKSSVTGSGLPVDIDAADRLARVQAGDLVTLRLLGDPGGLQVSRRFGDSPSAGPVRAWLCSRSERDTAGNVEIRIQLNGAANYVTNVLAPQSWFTAGAIPISDYPIYPTVDAPVSLQIDTSRPLWKPGILRNPNPIDGVDWEFIKGADSEPQSTIAKNSEFGGLGDATPFNSGACSIVLKGLNLSSFGNRIPNIQAVIREGYNCMPAQALAELLYIAGIPPALVKLDRPHFFQPFGSQQGNFVLGGSTPEPAPRAGASQFRATYVGGPLGFPGPGVFPGTVFSMGTVSNATEEDAEQFYRVIHVEPVSGETWIITVSPRLQRDYFDEQARTYFGIQPPLGGLIHSGISDLQPMVEKMLLAFGMQLRNRNGTLLIRSEGFDDELEILPSELDARESSAPPGSILPLSDPSTAQIPTRIDVRFRNVENDSQIGLTTADADNAQPDRIRLVDPAEPGIVATKDIVSAQINLTEIAITSGVAHGIARRALQRARDEAQTVTLRLPTRYHRIEPDDILRPAEIQPADLVETQVPLIYGRPFLFVVDRVDIGDNGIVECECFVRTSDASIPPAGIPMPLNVGVNPNPTTSSGPVHYAPWSPAAVAALFDVPALSDLHARLPGVYLLVGSASQRRPVSNVTVYRGETSGTLFYPAGIITAGSRLGTVVAGALENVEHSLFDYSSTITVHVEDGVELESVTEDEAMNGDNFAIIGPELVCFVSATLIAPRSYTLTGFRRGLLGTTANIAHHGTGSRERVAFLGNYYGADGFAHLALTRAEFGRDLEFRTVPAGFTVETGNRLLDPDARLECSRPRPVANLRWSRLPDDVVFEWDRIPRLRFRAFSQNAPPLLEVDEIYRVEIMDPMAPSNPIRTLTTASGVRTATYTLAQQTTDGVLGQHQLTCWVYRNSDETAESLGLRIKVNGQLLGAGRGHSKI